MNIKEQYQFLLTDIANHGNQGAWDWEADYRFAVFLAKKEIAADIKAAIESNATNYHRIKFYNEVAGKIKQQRLRRLRELKQLGKVKAAWVGNGEGAMSLYGTNRGRIYEAVSAPENPSLTT